MFDEAVEDVPISDRVGVCRLSPLALRQFQHQQLQSFAEVMFEVVPVAFVARDCEPSIASKVPGFRPFLAGASAQMPKRATLRADIGFHIETT